MCPIINTEEPWATLVFAGRAQLYSNQLWCICFPRIFSELLDHTEKGPYVAMDE